jgi:hypothetical protein
MERFVQGEELAFKALSPACRPAAGNALAGGRSRGGRRPADDVPLHRPGAGPLPAGRRVPPLALHGRGQRSARFSARAQPTRGTRSTDRSRHPGGSPAAGPRADADGGGRAGATAPSQRGPSCSTASRVLLPGDRRLLRSRAASRYARTAARAAARAARRREGRHDRLRPLPRRSRLGPGRAGTEPTRRCPVCRPLQPERGMAASAPSPSLEAVRSRALGLCERPASVVEARCGPGRVAAGRRGLRGGGDARSELELSMAHHMALARRGDPARRGDAGGVLAPRDGDSPRAPPLAGTGGATASRRLRQRRAHRER